MTRVDYLVVGSGLTGGTIARKLADAGREVLVLERRSHLGGNVHDFVHFSGIRVHSYGPHYFRCSSQRIWEFVNRFTRFVPYTATVKTQVDGRHEEWPINRKLFERHPGWEMNRPTDAPANFEEACLQKMPRQIYRKFIRGYTLRQWGMNPRLLDARLADRIRINDQHETSLTPWHRYQGLPEAGYAKFVENLLTGIPRVMEVDYLKQRSEFAARKAIIFTGSIDEFFGFEEGHLAYRGQHRHHEFLPHVRYFQPCAQVNHPDAIKDGPIRTLEWKHLMPDQRLVESAGTVLTREFPFSPKNPDQFEYPMPLAKHRLLFEAYRRRAARIANLVVCGRLGEYRYFDMDHAIGRALLIADRLASRHKEVTSDCLSSHFMGSARHARSVALRSLP